MVFELCDYVDVCGSESLGPKKHDAESLDPPKTMRLTLLFAGFSWISKPPVTWDPMILKVVLFWICKEGKDILTFLWTRIPLACSDVSDKWMLGIKLWTFGSIFWPQNLIPALKKKVSVFLMSYISFLEFPTGPPKSGRWVPYTFKSVVNLSSIAHHGTMITSFFWKIQLQIFQTIPGWNSTSVYHGNSKVPTPPNTTPSTHLPGVDDATCHLEAVSLIVINGDDMGPRLYKWPKING